MNSQIDWNLILHYLSDSLTSEEEEKLNSWLMSDFENRKLLHLIEAAWDSPEKDYRETDIKEVWKNIAQKAGISASFSDQPHKIQPLHQNQTKRLPFRHRSNAYRIMLYAATLIIVLSIHFFYKAIKPASQVEIQNGMQELHVDYGKTAVVTLTDGTKITLDAGSMLSYPEKFTGGIRKVFLTGEGYFDVASNSKKPFVIYLNNAIIRVVGTKFNVCAWPKWKDVRVAVTAGKVALRPSDDLEKNSVLIQKGELSVLRNNEKPTTPTRVDVDRYLAWINREMILNNTPLSEVLDTLERWYNLEFQLPNPVYNSVKISGKIKKESIENIIETISMAINLDFERKGNRIIFWEKS